MTVLRLRDLLVSWFADEATPQMRKGLRFTSAKVTEEEVRHAAQKRAQGFFQGLRSTYDHPTLEDLRKVKERMDHYLAGPVRKFPYEMLLLP